MSNFLKIKINALLKKLRKVKFKCLFIGILNIIDSKLKVLSLKRFFFKEKKS